MKSTLETIFRSIISGLKCAFDLVLPRHCIICGRQLYSSEKHICLHCLADMPMTHYWKRSHNPMADKFNHLVQQAIENNGLDNPQEKYSYGAALILFQDGSPYRKIFYEIKYKGNIEAGLHFGTMLGKRLSDSHLFDDVDIVVPVPLHWLRKWKRGYNQAEVIASCVAVELNAELRSDILYRKRKTQTQTKLDHADKIKNVAGAFEVRKDTLARLDGRLPEHIVVLDDVFTSGNTLHACFVALREVFPPSIRISVATLGFVGGA